MINSKLLHNLADQMPEMPDISNGRERLLYLCNMLKALTEPHRGLTIEEIRALIAIKGQANNPAFQAPSKNTIHHDLEALSKYPHLETRVHTPPKGTNEGFWLESLSLDQSRACLLVNITQACTFISQEQCDDLVERLRKIIPSSSQEDIALNVYVDSRTKSSSVDVFDALHTIANALNGNKMISYRYTYYGIDGQRHYVDECTEGRYLKETPLTLIFSNNNYYVETWDKNAAKRNVPWRRRLDRMEDITVSPEQAETNEEIRLAKSNKSVESRTRMAIDMLGDGEPCHLFLLVNETIAANIILNKFGYDCILATDDARRDKEGPDDKSPYGIAFITVQLSATFYRLLCGFGTMVQIAKPHYLWSDQTRWTKGRTENIPYGQLLEEYHRAINGYTEHLRNILQIYNENERLP